MKEVLKGARRFFSSILLSATMLSGVAGVSWLFGGGENEMLPLHPLRTNQETEVSPSFSAADSFYYPARKKTDIPVCRTRANQPADSVDPEVLPLWRNLQALKNEKSLLGPALHDFSARADLIYCYSPIFGRNGNFEINTGVVYITADSLYAIEKVFLTMVHETLHGIQRNSLADKTDMSWSIYDFQARVLSTEAAAKVAEYLIALDMLHAGNPAPMKGLSDKHPEMTPLIFKTYISAKKKTQSHAEALLLTGKDLFYRQFHQRWWVDSYNEDLLKDYVERIALMQAQPPSGNAFTLDALRSTGYISPEFNFTASAEKFPDDLFCGNDGLRQAFAYIEAERLAAVFGEKSPAYCEAVKKLKSERNPYAGISPMLLYMVAIDEGESILMALERLADKNNPPAGIIPQQMLAPPPVAPFIGSSK